MAICARSLSGCAASRPIRFTCAGASGSPTSEYSAARATGAGPFSASCTSAPTSAADAFADASSAACRLLGRLLRRLLQLRPLHAPAPVASRRAITASSRTTGSSFAAAGDVQQQRRRVRVLGEAQDLHRRQPARRRRRRRLALQERRRLIDRAPALALVARLQPLAHRQHRRPRALEIVGAQRRQQRGQRVLPAQTAEQLLPRAAAGRRRGRQPLAHRRRRQLAVRHHGVGRRRAHARVARLDQAQHRRQRPLRRRRPPAPAAPAAAAPPPARPAPGSGRRRRRRPSPPARPAPPPPPAACPRLPRPADGRCDRPDPSRPAWYSLRVVLTPRHIAPDWAPAVEHERNRFWGRKEPWLPPVRPAPRRSRPP